MKHDIDTKMIGNIITQRTLMTEREYIQTFVEIVATLRDQYKYSREGAVIGAGYIISELGANRRTLWINQAKEESINQIKEVRQKTLPATEKQIAYMKKLEIETIEGMTREQASEKIDAKLAEIRGE